MCSCDMPEFFSQKNVKGRKNYHCVECGIVIQSGEMHYVSTGKWSGDFLSFRQCVDCHHVMADCIKYADCSCDVSFCEVSEWVHEMRRDKLPTLVIERFDAFDDRLSKSRELTPAN